ncbi:MAG: four helix bundle protein [Chitinophagaceae bacterium]|nr:MAG: four helix bundle protein [Chitinophagaceae bacterium]
MATIRKFEEIEAWQKARVLASELFLISSETGLSKDYRFRDQVNAAAGSVMDNIAEGFERGGKLEFINFLTIAKASCAEVRSQLYRLLDRKYISEEKFNTLYKLAEDIGSKLGAWINYLNLSAFKGNKYKNRENTTQNPKP